MSFKRFLLAMLKRVLIPHLDKWASQEQPQTVDVGGPDSSLRHSFKCFPGHIEIESAPNAASLN